MVAKYIDIMYIFEQMDVSIYSSIIVSYFHPKTKLQVYFIRFILLSVIGIAFTVFKFNVNDINPYLRQTFDLNARHVIILIVWGNK